MPPAVATHTFDSLLERLHEFAARGFASHDVLPFLRSSLMDPGELERYLHWARGRYTRNLAFKCADFELLVLCWDVGQAAPAHGHEGEKCWARVERGRLRFRNFRETFRDGGRARLEPLGPAVDGGPGHVDGPAEIHSVENLAAHGARAVSLHLYSRPYSECDLYDLERGTVARTRLRYDSVGGHPCA